MEFTLCFVVIILLFIAAFKIFVWSGKTLVGRQNAFEATQTYSDPAVDFYTPESLNLTITIAPRPSAGPPPPEPTPPPAQGFWIEDTDEALPVSNCVGYPLSPPQGTCDVGDTATYCEPYTPVAPSNGGILHYYNCELE